MWLKNFTFEQIVFFSVKNDFITFFHTDFLKYEIDIRILFMLGKGSW